MPVSPDDLDRFRAFIARAGPLAAKPHAEAPIHQFHAFLAAAVPLVLRPLERHIPRLRRFADDAHRWHHPHDLLDIAGFACLENPYTELLAWALRPAVHPASALDRQAALLACFGKTASVATEPLTQVVTADGIPDLVLHWPDLVVVIEAKTGSLEHETPSGAWQTEAYPASVREALDVAAGVDVRVGYLTPDGHGARSADAVPITFLGVVERLMGALAGHELHPRTEASFAMLFTHFVDHAGPQGGRVRRSLNALRLDGGMFPAEHLPALLDLANLLDPGANRE